MTEQAKKVMTDLAEHLGKVDPILPALEYTPVNAFKDGFMAGYAERDKEIKTVEQFGKGLECVVHKDMIYQQDQREQKLVEALRFYADKEKYAQVDEPLVKTKYYTEIDADDWADAPDEHGRIFGGQLARATLKELGYE